MDTRIRADVVVVGARAAGAATAMLLARMGHDVVVVDRADLPSDTISTHQIARTGAVALHRWGLLDDVLASGAPALRHVTFHSGGNTTTRVVKDKAGVNLLLAPRRHVLDALLAGAARDSGARLSTSTTVTRVRLDDGGRAVGVDGTGRHGEPVRIDASHVVGADGLTSQVARSVGAAVVEDRGSGGATRYAYFGGVEWSGLEFYTEERAYAGVFPTHDGEAAVWICSPTEDARISRRRAGSAEEAFATDLRRVAPALAHRLANGRRTSPVRGMLRAPNQIRRAVGAGWALVGDAGYHRDAVTGHGISDAFRDAEGLAVVLDRVLRGETDEIAALAGYEQRRDAALREVFEVTCAMVAYPSVPEFIELTRRLGAAIDAEATDLAAAPVPGEPTLIAA